MAGKPQPRVSVVQPLEQSYRYIALTQNQIATVDAEDFERASMITWSARWAEHTHSFYAVGHQRGSDGILRTVYLHKFVMGIPPGDKRRCDHVHPEQTLDDRKENLRVCTNQENCCNRRIFKSNKSGLKWVHWHKTHKKWASQVRSNGKAIHLGYFTNKRKAYQVARDKASELHGKFARES